MLIKTINTEKLTTNIYETRAEMGAAAAEAAASAIKAVIEKKGYANVVFAAAPSQNEMLESLLKSDVDFSRVNAFHMDEYVGLSRKDAQSFATYLSEHLFDRAPFASVNLISAVDAEAGIAAYTELLKKYPTDVVCMGIGENGHIAFNDPPVADFCDRAAVKPVALDEICRRQQVNDGCFASLDEVPRTAITLTVPTLFAGGALFCIVPAKTKAKAVRDTLTGKIGEWCPATVLRRHENAVLYLDADSSALWEDIG